MKNILILIVIIFSLPSLYSQVAINTDGTFAHSSSMLEISSTDKGMLIPRMTEIQRDAISAGGWTVSGGNVYSNSNNVGVGTTSPGAELEISGHIWQTGIGNSVFLGEDAGANDDLSNNHWGLCQLDKCK